MDTENKYGTLAVQKELLKLLELFDKFCMANSIQYSISSGTLLGAVRYGGFIPWDDDIDIIVGRSEYEKLVRAFKKQSVLTMEKGLWIDRVRLVQHEKGLNGFLPTADIFIWDNVPENYLKARAKYYLSALMQGMLKGKPDYSRFSFANRVFSFIAYQLGRLFSKDSILRQYTKRIVLWGNSKPTKKVGNYVDQFYALDYKYDADILSKYERRKFESIEVNAFAQYDKYLRTLYGDDYMIPPKEKDRKPSHM